MFASDLVKKIRARGGRFLVQDSRKLWRDVGDRKAVKKTAQTLRDNKKYDFKLTSEEESHSNSDSTGSEDSKMLKRKAIFLGDVNHMNPLKRKIRKKEEHLTNNTNILTEAEVDWDGFVKLRKKMTLTQPLPLCAVSRVHV